jgi:hypothetical protein
MISFLDKMNTPTKCNAPSIIFSQKRRQMLILNSYIYKLNKNTTKVKYYRCDDRSCSVTLHTDKNDVLIKINGDHCHLPEPEKAEIRTFRQILKERAINEATPISKIYDEESAKAGLTTSSIAVLPSEREIST